MTGLNKSIINSSKVLFKVSDSVFQKDLYILAVAYIMEFGHSLYNEIVGINYGRCKGAKAIKILF